MVRYVLSTNPLSRPYIDVLSNAVKGTLVPLSLLELRRGGILKMIRGLRQLSADQLYIAYEDRASSAIAPVLTAAAFCTRAKQLFESDDRHSIKEINVRNGVYSLIALLASTALGVITVGKAFLSMKYLLMRNRISGVSFGQRLLFLNANLWFGVKAGGSVGHISGVLNGFAAQGHKVRFCSTVGRLMSSPSVEFEPLQLPKWYGVPWEINRFTFDQKIPRQLSRTINEFKPSHIYQRMSVGSICGVILSRKYSVPLILEYNGSEVWAAEHWGAPLTFRKLSVIAEDVCLRHAHLIVTVSEVLKEELIARGYPERRVVCYPNCVDPEIFDPQRISAEEVRLVRAHHALARDAIVVTFLGSFGPWHGVTVLGKAIRAMVEHDKRNLVSNNVQFLFVGDGPQLPDLKNVLGHLVSSELVRFAGLVPQEKAPLYLAASDILVSPHVPNPDGTAFFGSPTKLFEYMAMGKAIVASDLEQIGTILRPRIEARSLPAIYDHDSPALAVMCEPGSETQLAASIRFLLSNADWRARLGQNARSAALSKYTWKHHVAEITRAISNL